MSSAHISFLVLVGLGFLVEENQSNLSSQLDNIDFETDHLETDPKPPAYDQLSFVLKKQ